MASVDENRKYWESYAWELGGDEWSSPWGSASLQWAITIYPRIMAALPADRIVEIAPGFGRWTSFLLGQSNSYIGIDVSPRPVAFCQRTFGRLPQRPRFVLGDGASLPEVEDAHTDLVFSFDSLVHVELECIAAYAKEMYRVLRPGGYGFIHHSNMGAYESGTIPNPGWRGLTVSAENVGREFTTTGLQVVIQERTPWVFRGALTDCFSLVRKPFSGEVLMTSRQFTNETFIRECELATQMVALYHPRAVA